MAKEHITSRLDQQLVKRIRARAKAENRSISNMLETVLQDGMDYWTRNQEKSDVAE